LTRETKRRTINYKLVQLGDHPLSLQEMLEATLLDNKSKFHLASNRRETLTDDDKSFRFINRFSNYESSMLLCQMVQFEQGRSQMTIVIDDKAEMFEVTPISAQDIKQTSADKRNNNSTEFLESMLYFAIKGNHMVVMGSQALKSKELERHLNWYLNSLTQQGIESAIILSDKPTAAAMKLLAKAPAKSVSVGSDITYEQSVDSPQYDSVADRDVTEAKSVRWTPTGLGANLLEYLRDKGYIDNFDFNETLDDANLQVSIEFKYSRQTTITGQKVIDSLSTSLRHLDDDDVRVNLKGGGEIRGGDLRLSHQISVAFINGKVDEPDLYYQMKDWLTQKVKTAEVTPDLNDLIEV
jgi:hypothetical protein